MTAAPFMIATAAFVGCAPKGGGVKEEVVEIEEIEMAPAKPATQEPAAAGEEARKVMDEEKAAADKVIEEAGKSSEPPAETKPAEPPHTLIKGMMPEVLPTLPTCSPIDLKFPQ